MNIAEWSNTKRINLCRTNEVIFREAANRVRVELDSAIVVADFKVGVMRELDSLLADLKESIADGSYLLVLPQFVVTARESAAGPHSARA